MKKQDRTSHRKLIVRKDTLRQLTPVDDRELIAAVGGRGPPRTGHCTRGGDFKMEGDE